jgi:hypothetical protein
MKILLAITVTAWLLVGCATSSLHHTEWEYKIAAPPSQGSSYGNRANQAEAGQALENRRKVREEFLNDMGRDGWILVEKDEAGWYYFKRAKR